MSLFELSKDQKISKYGHFYQKISKYGHFYAVREKHNLWILPKIRTATSVARVNNETKLLNTLNNLVNIIFVKVNLSSEHDMKIISVISY